jgi:signal transduction histidine kinase/CheY-like chemotaxis protein
MTARLRVVLFISTIFALLAASLFIVFNTILLQGFLQLEDESAYRNTARVIEAVKALQEEVAVKAEEWGTWDDSYAYIKKRRPQYESSNLTYDALSQLSLRHFLMTDLKGKVIKGLFIDGDDLTSLDQETSEILLRVVAKTLESKSRTAGIVEIHGETYIVGSAPVTNSAGDAPINGAVLFTRNFDNSTIEKVAAQTKTFLTVDKIENLKQNQNYGGGFDKVLKTGAARTVLTPSDIFGLDIISDIFGTPVRAAVIAMKRDILARGLQARNVVTTYVLGFTLVALILSLFLLNRILLSPLDYIGQQTKAIGYDSKSPSRIEPVGDAELQALSTSINRMLDSLSTAHANVVAAQQQAEAANYAKSTFIARVSHELRNPIHGIRGINHLILKRESSKAVGDLVKMGDSAAESLLSIVDEILDFSKAEAGELTFESIPYDVRQIVRETMQVAAARLEGKYRSGETERVQLICEVDSKLPLQLKGDPTRLKQVFINLLTNAVKFTERGCVGLKLEAGSITESAVELKISVWDTGIGIPEDKLDTLFTPFKQADETIARKYQGTGLGLSIVKQFVEGLGGSVSVRSVKGEGSTFEVSLKQPLAVDSRSAAEHLLGKLPSKTYLAAVPNRASQTLLDSLSAIGADAVAFNPLATSDVALVEAGFKTTGLLIISEEILTDKTATQRLAERIKGGIGCTAVLLRPASLELREKLYGQGLKLIFTLPVLADDILTAYAAGPSLGEGVEDNIKQAIESIKKLRVIIADDAPTNRIILQEMLEDSGHEVVPVGDGKDILSLVTPMLTGREGAEHYDLVITDVSMAIMNGDEAARRIRDLESANSTVGHIPIIAVTGQAFESELKQIRESGIDGILTKPMHPSQLEAELARLFRS